MSADDLTGRSLLSAVGLAAQGALRFLYSATVGRVAGAAVLGSVNAAVSVASLVGILWPLSIGSAATRYVGRFVGASDEESAADAAGFLARRLVFSSVPVAFLGAWLATSLLDLWLTSAMMVAALVISYSAYAFVRGLQLGQGQFLRVTAWEVFALVIALGALPFFLRYSGVAAALVPLCLAYGAFAIQGWPRNRRTNDLSRQLRNEIDRFVLLSVVGSIFSVGFVNGSMILAEVVGSGPQAGYYSAGLSLAVGTSLAARAVGVALLPSMAAAHGRGDESVARAMSDAGTRFLVLTMVPLFGLVVTYAPNLITLLFGRNFEAVGLVSALLVLALLPNAMAMAAVSELLGGPASALRAIVGVAAIAVTIGAILWVVLIDSFGVLGVAWGFFVASSIQGFGYLLFAWRTRGFRWWSLMTRAGISYGLLLTLIALRPIEGLSSLSVLLVLSLLMAIWVMGSWGDARLVYMALRRNRGSRE